MDRRMLITSGAAAGGIAGASAVVQGARAGVRTAPTRLKVLASDGAQLFVRSWGEGRSILFVHSWALAGAMWQHQFIGLGDRGVHSVAYDRRGHGRSDAPAGGYDIDTLADDLAQVIEQTGLRDVVLVGHSFGCSEIVRYLGRHGGARVAKVVLISPTTPYLTKTSDNAFGAPPDYFETLRSDLATDFPKWIEDNKRPFFMADTSPAMMDWVSGMMLEAHLPALLACNRTSVETDFRPDLARIRLPTLVIHGDKDATAPIDITGRRTAAAIAGARFTVYEGAPHGIFVTHAKRLNADIAAFAA